MTERFRVGAFEQIYDPSVGEPERWYINDHTFIRDHEGTWHLIGITHAEPAAPFDERHLAHATAPTLHGPWTKQPFALSIDPAWGETHLWAPHVIEHDSMYWMYYCAGGADKSEYRIHLATSDDCVTWTRHPENPMVVDGFEAPRPDGALGRRPVAPLLHGHERAGGRRVHRRCRRVARPRALDRPPDRVPGRADRHGCRADRVAVRGLARRHATTC